MLSQNKFFKEEVKMIFKNSIEVFVDILNMRII